MVTVKSDESMSRHKKNVLYKYLTVYNALHLPNSYLRLMRQPCCLCIFVRIATVTVKDGSLL